MLIINNTYKDAWFNLAAEEYLLKNFSDSIFMLWQNEPSVIIGKHQHVWDEINTEFVKDKQIKVVRRFSGGGAVYHDPGNLNLTFIESSNRINSGKFTDQIIRFLETVGIHALSDERQGLTIDGLKISGSAQSIHKNRVMHHATLLYSTDLDSLTTALQVVPRNTGQPENPPRSIYVKSVRSPVTNISAHIRVPQSISEFKIALMNYFTRNNDDARDYLFTEKDLNAINALRDEKYVTPEWNYNTYTL